MCKKLNPQHKETIMEIINNFADVKNERLKQTLKELLLEFEREAGITTGQFLFALSGALLQHIPHEAHIHLEEAGIIAWAAERKGHELPSSPDPIDPAQAA